MATDVLDQTITPAVRMGEDASLALSGTGATSQATWTLKFVMARVRGGPPEVTSGISGVTVTVGAVTGSGPYSATITAAVPAAVTATLADRDYYWELWRTDAGSRKILAAGTWAVVDPTNPYP